MIPQRVLQIYFLGVFYPSDYLVEQVSTYLPVIWLHSVKLCIEVFL
jgi:hypothetical protein